MNKTEKRGENYCRWHEVLFSANLGVAITAVLRTYIATVAPGRSKLVDFTVRMVIYVNGTLGLRPQAYNPIGLEIAFLIVLIAVGLGVLLGVWAFPKRVRFFALRFAGIFSSLVAVPAALLYSHYAFEFPRPDLASMFISPERMGWFGLELTAVAVCQIIESIRKLSLRSWGKGLLLVVHYSLWGWYAFQGSSHLFWALTLSLVPPCSVLAWIWHVQWLRKTGV